MTVCFAKSQSAELLLPVNCCLFGVTNLCKIYCFLRTKLSSSFVNGLISPLSCVLTVYTIHHRKILLQIYLFNIFHGSSPRFKSWMDYGFEDLSSAKPSLIDDNGTVGEERNQYPGYFTKSSFCHRKHDSPGKGHPGQNLNLKWDSINFLSTPNNVEKK
ncbi:hypothetical protein AVEN_212824-1 [Araneus ventricosus]|uniref:Uncharacterized protein n=1 Tax=Araneus ventricosus TaxID=182803 RepID=A0A4Y1ZVS2_ARAVE|nr:hypothetical protein AVEN_212824-1 [Araneus ventricosus]